MKKIDGLDGLPGLVIFMALLLSPFFALLIGLGSWK